jgi:monoterpene epsilon-lactone hydrolase
MGAVRGAVGRVDPDQGRRAGLPAGARAPFSVCGTLPVDRPRGLILLSPWLDLTITAGTYTSRADSDALFSKASAQEAAGQYLQGHSAEDPLASPLFADPSGFPPALLFASADESLLDDTLGFAARLAEARVPVETHIVPGMPHVWPVIAPQSTKSALVFEEIARFVDGL